MEASLPAPDNSYASLGEHMAVIVERLAAIVVRAEGGDVMPLLTTSELVFLRHLANVELPATDETMQSFVFQAATMAREALTAKKLFEQMQMENSNLHERNVNLGVALADTTKKLEEVLSNG